MSQFTVLGLALFAGVSFLSATMALLLLSALDLRRRYDRRSILMQGDELTVFLFDDDGLIDATPAARQFLSAAPRGDRDWARLMGLLSPHYPDLCDDIASLADIGRLEREANDKSSTLRAELRGDLLRLTLIDPETGPDSVPVDRHSLDAMERELETLRAMSDHAPFLIWRQSPDGAITWVNRTYLETVARVHGRAATESWPPPALFETGRSHGQAAVRRVSLRQTGSTDRDWYECHAAALGPDTLFTAVDANATVMAEAQLREFMQTLTKTFAHLTIGLAVFDRARRLALFNPALTDLTGLQIDFLTARPTLFGVLDKLRERHMIPEPKDYTTWRRRIVELEAAASDGSYAETWSLPHGQTYRVTGRPHPDGAVAFLFEDISAEVSLTRRFRAEIELGQSALDCIEDAVAVFSSAGTLVMANTAYGALWGSDPESGLGGTGVVEATRIWMARTAPSPIWGDLRDFVTGGQDRSEWSADARLKDGRALSCRFVPIAGGATLVRFHPGQAKVAAALAEPQRA